MPKSDAVSQFSDKGSKIVRFQNLSFCVPDGTREVMFDHREGQVTLRLFLRQSEKEFTVNIEKRKDDHSAKLACKNKFLMANPVFESENIKPYLLDTILEIWRCGYRFVDGTHAPFVMDLAFIQNEHTVYKFHLISVPSSYQVGKELFGNLLQTVRIGE